MGLAKEHGDPRPPLAATVGSLVEAGQGTPREALLAIAGHGYAAVQWSATTPSMRPREFDGSARRGLAAELRRLELRCAGVDAWVPPGHLLDPTTIDRAIAAIEQAIRFAAEMVLPGGSADLRPTVSLLLPTDAELAARPTIAGQLREALRQLSVLAEREGVAVADHALDRIADSPLAIGIDPGAFLAAGRDPSAAVLAAGARLAGARLVDCFRSGLRGPILEPGESRLDVTAYRVALECVGFHRPLVVDARQWRDPLRGLIATIERWVGGSLRRAPIAAIDTERRRGEVSP